MRRTASLPTLVILAGSLAACSTSDPFADRLAERSSAASSLSRDYERGQAEIRSGRDRIESGRKQIRRGERDVSRGEDEVASGERRMREARLAFCRGEGLGDPVCR